MRASGWPRGQPPAPGPGGPAAAPLRPRRAERAFCNKGGPYLRGDVWRLSLSLKAATAACRSGSCLPWRRRRLAHWRTRKGLRPILRWCRSTRKRRISGPLEARASVERWGQSNPFWTEFCQSDFEFGTLEGCTLMVASSNPMAFVLFCNFPLSGLRQGPPDPGLFQPWILGIPERKRLGLRLSHIQAR